MSPLGQVQRPAAAVRATRVVRPGGEAGQARRLTWVGTERKRLELVSVFGWWYVRDTPLFPRKK